MHGNQHQGDQSAANLTARPNSNPLPAADDGASPNAPMESEQLSEPVGPGAHSASAVGSAEGTKPHSAVGTAGNASEAHGNGKPDPRPFLNSAELAAVAKVVGPSSFGTWPRLITEADIDRVVQMTNLAYQDATYFKAREWWDRVNATKVRTLSAPSNPKSAWVAIDGPPDTPFANQVVAAFNLHDDDFLPGRVTVSMLAVDPTMHRRGLAKYCFALVWEAVRLIHARDLRLAVAKEGGQGDGKWTPAKVLVEVVNLQKHLLVMYNKMGFVVVGERTWDEYRIPAHFFTMQCHLVLMEKEVVDPPTAVVDDDGNSLN